MRGLDDRGGAVTGATPAALQAYERALSLFLNWRGGAEAQLAPALRHAPRFVMAHLLQAWLRVCSRDPRSIRSARPILAHVAGLPANEDERLHRAALAAALDDDYEGAQARLGTLLRRQPRDGLALQVVHAFDHVTGDAVRMRDRVAAVLPAWSAMLPGYDAVLAMHAFALEECGEYGRAEQDARAALALNPFNARAHHVMAHVFEMTARPEAGKRWMNEHVSRWGVDTTVATHGHWHLALFHLARGETDRALALYDRRVRRGRSTDIADLIDAAALLWRVQLQAGDIGRRPLELAEAWAAHIDDAFCSFNDLHAMLAFVAARDGPRVQRLERALVQAQSRPTRHGLTTRQFGLGACRALAAFGRGDDSVAISLLAGLPAQAHRIGGSQAQRDVLHLTLQRALERVRRPVERAQPERQVCFS
jgi:tetratricopeptide (TPR) repeat protein